MLFNLFTLVYNHAAAAARREMVANHQRLLSRAAVGGRGISVRVPGEACHSDGVVVAAPS